MWPFKRKPRAAPKKDWIDEGIETLESIFKLGDQFEYLGRQCVVTRHFEYLGMCGVIPSLVCDYVDGQGVIHKISFRVDEAVRLSQGKEKVQP